MNVDQVRTLVKAYFRNNLEAAEDARTRGAGRMEDSEDGESGLEGLELYLEGLKEDLARGDLRGIARVADDILKEAGIDLPKDSHDYRKLAREALKGAIAAIRIELDRLRSRYREYEDLTDVPSADEKAEEQPKGEPKLLSKMIAAYSHEAVTGKRWKGRTKMEAEGCLSLFVQIVGDRDIRTLTRADFIGFRDVLQRWPASASKSKKYRGKTAQEILALSAKGSAKILSAKTINKYLMFLGALMSWAVANGHAATNYAMKLSLSKRTMKPSEEKSAYSPEDIKKLLASPIYQTAVTPRPERYWIPLVALFSGLRLAEIAQLYLEDVRTIDGVPCFDVNGAKDKSLKTVSSHRIVPVHPCLISLGLLEYAKGLRKKKAFRLWPNLQRTQTGYGQDFGRFFQRWNRVYVTSDAKKTFHSFRASFITALLNAGVELALVQALDGHAAGGGETGGRYFKGHPIATLKAAIDRLDYGEEVMQELKKLPRLI